MECIRHQFTKAILFICNKIDTLTSGLLSCGGICCYLRTVKENIYHFLT